MTKELVVHTSYGPVQGRHRVGWEGVKYVSFQGIPYARPPVGELRFKVQKIILIYNQNMCVLSLRKKKKKVKQEDR